MKRKADRRVYQLQAEICKVLANPIRLEILNLIGDREVAYGELLSRLGISKTNLSQHLALLRQSGVLVDRREGVHSYYRLTFPEIEEACRAVQNIFAKRLRETGRQAKMLLRQVG